MIARPSSKFCKLNLFQQVMALWEEVEPYNASHVLRLRGRADIPRLHAAVQTACRLAGVETLVVDREKNRYHYEPTESIELREVESGDSVVETLCRTVNEEMNTPFPEGPHHPLRWLVLDDRKSGSHYLVAIWRHLPADDVSIRLLIRRVLNRYSGTLQPGDDKPLHVLPPDYARVMRHHYWRLGYLTTFHRAARLYLRLRHVYRLPEFEAVGGRSQFSLFEAPPGLIGRLAAACRSRQVTVHDAFLAALGAAIAETTPHRCRHPRRRALALSSAVNVRPHAREDLSHCFGLYLGHWVTIIDQPETGDLGQLLTRIAEQTRLEKAERRAVGPAWNFWAVTRFGRWFSPKGTRGWYRKVYPISAGLSHVKLSAPWFKGAAENLLDYIRISPTGPALPLVLASARMGDRLNFSLGYHYSSLTSPEARKLIRLFLVKLERLAGRGNAGFCGFD